MEKFKIVKPVKVEYVCDNCLEGTMVPYKGTGFFIPGTLDSYYTTDIMGKMTLAISPPAYYHECTNCKYVQSFPVEYPVIRYEEM